MTIKIQPESLGMTSIVMTGQTKSSKTVFLVMTGRGNPCSDGMADREFRDGLHSHDRTGKRIWDDLLANRADLGLAQFDFVIFT